MTTLAPRCRTISVHTFRGSRGALGKRVRKSLNLGPEPTRQECLLYTGHTGVSTDSDKTIYGFNPEIGRLTISQAMQRLLNGDALPALVVDDSLVFVEASRHRLRVMTFDVILPDPDFRDFERKLAAERRKSRYTYGFPDGDGQCNCTTWLERLALPLLSGSMGEFTALSGLKHYPMRRFGRCV